MTEDIVDRLRREASEWDDFVFSDPMVDAADEIVSLRARLAAAEKVVEELRRFECQYPDCGHDIDELIAAYDAAKGGQP